MEERPDHPPPPLPPSAPISPSAEPSRGPWLGLGIGFALILLVVGFLLYSSRNSPTRYVAQPAIMQSSAADPYAGKLEISGVKMSAAENMLGGTAIYVEGQIKNNGERTVKGATIEITFQNGLKQVVQRETQPLMVVARREPAVDLVALNVMPMKPGDAREFRLTFEHVSADWDRKYPALRVTTISLK